MSTAKTVSRVALALRPSAGKRRRSSSITRSTLSSFSAQSKAAKTKFFPRPSSSLAPFDLETSDAEEEALVDFVSWDPLEKSNEDERPRAGVEMIDEEELKLLPPERGEEESSGLKKMRSWASLRSSSPSSSTQPSARPGLRKAKSSLVLSNKLPPPVPFIPQQHRRGTPSPFSSAHSSTVTLTPPRALPPLPSPPSSSEIVLDKRRESPRSYRSERGGPTELLDGVRWGTRQGLDVEIREGTRRWDGERCSLEWQGEEVVGRDEEWVHPAIDARW